MKANDFGLQEIDLLAIIRRIDTDGDACLDFNEFSEFLKPLSPEVAVQDPKLIPDRRSMAATSANHRGGSPLRGAAPVLPGPPLGAQLFVTPPGTKKVDRPILKVSDEDELIIALREQCKLERELEGCKISLAEKSDFNLFDAFNIFDPSRIGQISIHDLREGLNHLGVYPAAEEIELFVTRYDRTFDRRLTFAEFSEAFLPLDPYFCTMLNKRRENPPRKAMYKRDDCFLQDT